MSFLVEKAKERELTQNELKTALYYDENNGIFTRKVPTRKVRIGDIAGTINSSGYNVISVNGKAYYAHRLAMLYINGYFPEETVDHINRDRSDNSYSNLRIATKQCQARNSKNLSTNNSGIKGVSWDKANKKWSAGITINGKGKKLGRFHSKIEAACHRFSAEQCVGFQDCEITSSAKRYINKHLKK